jgi:hypothetical protein
LLPQLSSPEPVEVGAAPPDVLVGALVGRDVGIVAVNALDGTAVAMLEIGAISDSEDDGASVVLYTDDAEVTGLATDVMDATEEDDLVTVTVTTCVQALSVAGFATVVLLLLAAWP